MSSLSGLLGLIFALQRRLNMDLRHALRSMQDESSLAAALTIIGLAFIYGVLHAAGPGHGKIVIGSYLIAHRSALRRALLMAAISSLVQSFAAILLVALLAGLLDMGGSALMEKANLLELASYGLIAIIGLNMSWQALRGRDECCDHGHLGEAPVCAHEHNHDHQHGQHEHCDHDHPHHHEAAHPAPLAAARDGLRTLVSASVAVGLRPCSGAILVLLFTLANGLFTVGIIATLAMGVGVALTVTILALLAVALNRASEKLSNKAAPTTSRRIKRALSIAAGLVIALSGIILALGSINGGGLLDG